MAEPGQRGAIVAVLMWLVLSLAGIGIGYGWAHDQGGGTGIEPKNVGIIEVGTCQRQWTGVWHCEPVLATWGEGATPRDSTVHAGRDVSGRTVDVEWLGYSSPRGKTVVLATGPDAPIGNAALFLGFAFGATCSVGVAALLVAVGRVVSKLNKPAERVSSAHSRTDSERDEHNTPSPVDSPDPMPGIHAAVPNLPPAHRPSQRAITPMRTADSSSVAATESRSAGRNSQHTLTRSRLGPRGPYATDDASPVD